MDEGRRAKLRETQAQFGRQARRYADSALHRRGESLQTLLTLAGVQPQERVLDVGTGAGSTALRLSGQAGLVLAADPTRQMLDEARRLESEAGNGQRGQWSVGAA